MISNISDHQMIYIHYASAETHFRNAIFFDIGAIENILISLDARGKINKGTSITCLNWIYLSKDITILISILIALVVLFL